MYKKDLGIVICNFNKKDYLKGCLESLYKSDLKNLTYDVIVVDNASTDGSASFVKENYPEIILLENEINTGGSGGFDRGIRFCIDKKYKYVALLDNDILLEENTIIELINYQNENPNAGVVGSKICTMDNPDILQEMGSFIDFDISFNVKTPYKGYKDTEELPDVVNCDYVPACCMITTNDVLEKVGSFDTRHFIYWDDMDWCTRVKYAGYEVHAINSSRVFHKMGAANHINTFGVYYFERNRILFFLKYLNDKKVEHFINSISQWFRSLIFFSNEKKMYATAKSLLMALDDLLLKKLGKCDESILVKEKGISIFEKHNISNTMRVAFVFRGSMNANRSLFLAFEKYFGTLKYFAACSIEQDSSQSFNVPVINESSLDDYDIVIKTYDHIMDYEDDTIKHSNSYIMDSYFNSINEASFHDLQNSYETFNNIYENVFAPVLQIKLLKVREFFKDNNEI